MKVVSFIIKRLKLILLPFLGGAVVTANLSILIETNSNYEAAWWKVILAIAITLTVFLWKDE